MSMKCPKCSAKAKIIDSRQRQNHTTTRRYECDKCKDRWSTLEIFARNKAQPGHSLKKAIGENFEKRAKESVQAQLEQLVADFR